MAGSLLPQEMTSAERRMEIAKLLAGGFLRLQQSKVRLGAPAQECSPERPDSTPQNLPQKGGVSLDKPTT